MKKVLVLLALATMAAAPALAAVNSIKGSKHDLSSQNASGHEVNVSGNSNEICVYCHTPHGAKLSGPPNTLPLWNRTDVTFNSTDLYNSTSLNALSRPAAVSAEVAASDAPLCFSCHDDTYLGASLQNPPNSLGSTAISISPSTLTTADLGADLTNDHPIGMDYDALATDEGVDEFHAMATTGLPFFTGVAESNVMWCSSCHDVHDPGYDATASYAGTQFMQTTMYGSALCLKCHNK